MFGTSAQKMRRLKDKFKFCHEVKTSSRDTYTALSHIHHRAITISLMFNFSGRWRETGVPAENMQTSNGPSEAKTLLLRGSCAAPAPPRCPTFKKVSLIFFLLQHHAINLVSLPHQFSPHEASGFPRITAVHSISWNCTNSRLVSVTSYRAWWLQATLKQRGFRINSARCEHVNTHQGHTPSISGDCNLHLLMLSFCPTVKHLVLVTPLLAYSSEIQLEQLPSTQLRILAELILHAFCFSPAHWGSCHP